MDIFQTMVMLLHTDYGHTKAESQIICGTNSNPTPKYGVVFYRNNGWIMENMDKGLTVKYKRF